MRVQTLHLQGDAGAAAKIVLNLSPDARALITSLTSDVATEQRQVSDATFGVLADEEVSES